MTPPTPELPPSPPVEQTLEQAIAIISPGYHMGLDLFLAIVPLVLALLLFRIRHPLPPFIWWPLLVVFGIFLPNAPYVFTDVVEFTNKVRVSPALPLWATSLLVMEYGLYFLIGAQSLTLSLMLWGRHLRRHGWPIMIIPLETVVLALSSFGMYLGRFDRFNGWDLATIPERLLERTLMNAMSHRPEEITLLFFGAVALIYYVLKMTNLGVARLLRHRPEEIRRRSNMD